MSPEAFDSLCTLLRMRNGPMRHGARLVLVNHVKPRAAALLLGCTEQGIRDAVQRMRRGRDAVNACAAQLAGQAEKVVSTN